MSMSSYNDNPVQNTKTRLINILDNLPNSNKEDFQKALKKVSKARKFLPTHTIFGDKLILPHNKKTFKSQLLKFSFNQNKIGKKIYKLSKETGIFSNDYKKINEENKKKAIAKEDDFLEKLIIEYKNRGYKNEQLVSNRNLFEPTTLLRTIDPESKRISKEFGYEELLEDTEFMDKLAENIQNLNKVGCSMICTTEVNSPSKRRPSLEEEKIFYKKNLILKKEIKKAKRLSKQIEKEDDLMFMNTISNTNDSQQNTLPNTLPSPKKKTNLKLTLNSFQRSSGLNEFGATYDTEFTNNKKSLNTTRSIKIGGKNKIKKRISLKGKFKTKETKEENSDFSKTYNKKEAKEIKIAKIKQKIKENEIKRIDELKTVYESFKKDGYQKLDEKIGQNYLKKYKRVDFPQIK